MANLKINERRSGSVVILDLEGTIKLGEGCAELHKTLRRLIENGDKNVLLNLQNVNYIDSSGLGELVGGYTAFKRVDGEIKLLHLSSSVHDLIVLTKLLTVFDIFENEATAIESYNASINEKSAQVSQ